MQSIDLGQYKEVNVTGDFNFDALKLEQDNEVQLFSNTMSTFSILPLISKPTRIAEDTMSLLDNILLGNPFLLCLEICSCLCPTICRFFS